jgi:diadenosine tetraphosphatase ApaH/serine/threonine PP2A family protein phosphatase
VEQTIIIGDVHGCIAEAEELLGACEWQPGTDVIFVGDLVGRGPEPGAVIGLARDIGARAVLGNHEQAWLRFREEAARGRLRTEIGPLDIKAALGLEERHWDFLSGLPLYIRLPDVGAVVVHAGLERGVKLEDQDTEIMLNIRSIRADGSCSDANDGVPWASLWPGPEEVVFGHNASRGLQRQPFATGLDTGCVYGKSLTAYLLPERRLVSVPARRAYRAIRSGGG